MKKVFAIFSLITTFSCTKVIDLNIPDEAPKLVVNAPFSPDSTWKILVGKTGPSVGIVSPITSIANASINLQENGTPLTGWVVEKELSFGGGWNPNPDTLYYFTLPGKKPVVGAAYQLEVSAPNTVTATASANCIAPVPLKNVVHSSQVYMMDQEFYDECTFEISDPSGGNDYYQIQLLMLDSFSPFPELRGYPFYCNDVIINEFTDKGTFGPQRTSLGFQLDEPFFSDAFFDGQTRSFKIHFPSYYLTISSEIQFVLVRYSKELFQHERSLRMQFDVGNNPFSEPVRIISNIQNGVGIFGSKTKDIHVIK